jgi:hypothetical protein
MEDEDEYFIPLQDQRVFGAGIKRKRVQFVPASTTTSTLPKHSIKSDAADLYLSIVLPDKAQQNDSSSVLTKQHETHDSLKSNSSEKLDPSVCEICKLPIQSEETDMSLRRPHEASISHQVCLTHSHPPSHIDRNRPGLKYLSSYGWDPNSRLGLGATGDGIRIPIKGKIKNNTVGLGIEGSSNGKKEVKAEKIETLDAGKVRKKHEKERAKGERLREMFYASDDITRYLGSG